MQLADEDATCLFAQRFARACIDLRLIQPGLVVYLDGDLGAGKTSFCRAFIQYFLPEQRVKSPTYTLVEGYSLAQATVFHFDLYRLCEPEELEYIGVRDLLEPPFVALVEWPTKGEGVLPAADFVINLHPAQAGRELVLQAVSASAKSVWAGLELRV